MLYQAVKGTMGPGKRGLGVKGLGSGGEGAGGPGERVLVVLGEGLRSRGENFQGVSDLRSI